jgi:hypothetical protein
MNASMLANARAVAADGAVEDVTALVEAIRDTHTVKMRALHDAHAAEMQVLRDSHAAAMNASMLANARDADAAAMDVSALMEAIRNEHAADMQALRDSYAAEMRALRDAHAEEVDHLEIWGNEWLEAEHKSRSRELQLSQQLNDVREEQEMALRCAQVDHEDKAQALRDELKTLHELCTAHEDEIERLKRSLSISERAHEAAQSKPNVQQHFGSISLATCHWAAKRGDATAQFTMANFYYTGMEVSDMQLPQNMSKALKWWRRATNQGHAEASAALESQAAQGVFEELTEMPESIAALIKVFRAHSYVGGSSSPKYLVMKTKAGTSHTLLNPTAGIKPDSITDGAYSPLTNFTHIGVTLRDRNGVPLSCCGNDCSYRSVRHDDTKWIYCISWNLKPNTSGTQSDNRGYKSLSHGIVYYVCKSCRELLGVPR